MHFIIFSTFFKKILIIYLKCIIDLIMKILAIIGSPRKKNTYEFVKKIEEKINQIQKVDFDYLFLNEVNLEFCKGCGLCRNDENLCSIKDDAEFIRNKILKCDGIILSSPVYSYRETGLIKIFFDRFNYFHFRPFFLNKPAIILAITGSKGLDEVLNYLNFTAKSWGFTIIGKTGIAIGNYILNKSYKEKIDKKIEIISNNIIKHMINKKKKLINPSLNDLLLFKEKKELVFFIKNKNSQLYDFWDKNGWLNKDYYYNVKINLFKKILLKFMKFDLNKN